MQHTVNGVTTPYYFHRNPLGDVVGIYNTNGTQIAKYIYDAWGNCTISGDTTVAKANPIRYRGYYYDDDTGLYYCNARYYSPKWRRFISPDSTNYLDPESVNGLNQYCYCNNDPINYTDPSGHFVISLSFLIASAAIGAAFGATISGVTAYAQGERGWDLAWDIVGGALFGAAIGATAALGGAAGLGAVAPSAVIGGVNVSMGAAIGMSIGGMAFASATRYSLDCAASERSWSFGGYLAEAAQGAIQGAATFGWAYLGGKAGLFNHNLGQFNNWCDFYIKYGGLNPLKTIGLVSNVALGPFLSKLLLVSGVGAGIRWVINQLIPEF